MKLIFIKFILIKNLDNKNNLIIFKFYQINKNMVSINYNNNIFKLLLFCLILLKK